MSRMKLPGVLALIAGMVISLGASAQTLAPATTGPHARKPAVIHRAPSRTGHRTLGPRHNLHRTPVHGTMVGPRM
jgi:hypothetical protein